MSYQFTKFKKIIFRLFIFHKLYINFKEVIVLINNLKKNNKTINIIIIITIIITIK